MNEMMAIATERGLNVTWDNLGYRNGEYRPGTITLNHQRTQTTQRVTLAHELGHAHYEHTWTDDPVLREVQERIADRYAAHLLITADAYERAERVVGCHPGALARELGVTRRLVELWQDAELARRSL